MTRLFTPEPLSGLSNFDLSYMSNYQDYAWQQPQHYTPTSVPSSQYGEHQISVHDVDARVYRPGQTGYVPFPGSQHLLSPDAAYGEGNWTSDMDIGTPSTAHSGFSNELLDTFSPKMHSANVQQPAPHKQGPAKAQQWVLGDSNEQRSQNSHRAALARPQVQRAHTGPEARQRRVTVPNTRPDESPNIKRSGSEESEDDYVPDGDTKNRGRKRQRIPHTAVERRYRENLNAHLDRLRQAVPALATRRPSGSAKVTDAGNDQGAKPSKCEILSGAIEHISLLGKENDALRSENQVLRNRMQELERWYTSSMHQASYP